MMDLLLRYWWIVLLCLIPIVAAVIYFLGEADRQEKRLLEERLKRLEEKES